MKYGNIERRGLAGTGRQIQNLRPITAFGHPVQQSNLPGKRSDPVHGLEIRVEIVQR